MPSRPYNLDGLESYAGWPIALTESSGRSASRVDLTKLAESVTGASVQHYCVLRYSPPAKRRKHWDWGGSGLCFEVCGMARRYCV